MLSIAVMRSIANARIKDSRVLESAKRYDGAYYLCGYSVEIALKARICKTLKWPGFPETNREFEGRTSLKSHSLEGLLLFSGLDSKVRSPTYGSYWSLVSQWNPENRYRALGTVTAAEAKAMIESASVLVRLLLPR
jgi:hypothetical protein